MASFNTLCKQLLGVKSTVVTGHDFYQGGRCPVHPPDLTRSSRSVPDAMIALSTSILMKTSYRKGHKYITVVVNHDTNIIVWAAQA